MSNSKAKVAATAATATTTTTTPPPPAAAKESKKDKGVTFESLGLCPELCDAVKKLNWSAPTPIQRQALPPAFSGRDIIGLAQTGSGKTAAYSLPLLQALLENPTPFYGVVILPTRELAAQVTEHIEALGSTIGVKCATLIGGVDVMKQAIALAKRPHIVVGTPGRIVYHLENTKGFSLRSTCKYVVIDEADRLLGLDFEKELDTILASVMPKEKRVTYLYSATMTTKVDKLQRASLRNPMKVQVDSKYKTVDTLKQEYMFVPFKYREAYLVYALNEAAGQSTIIFCAKRLAALRISYMLRNLGFSAIPLTGNMTQPKRLGALEKFKAGERSILVATDVASRGLDIPQVDFVINHDIPPPREYIHRVGRTARAGHSGHSLTIVTQYSVELFQQIEANIGKKMDKFPSAEEQVLVFLPRVTEALRYAAVQMKEDGFDSSEATGRQGFSSAAKMAAAGSADGREDGDEDFVEGSNRAAMEEAIALEGDDDDIGEITHIKMNKRKGSGGGKGGKGGRRPPNKKRRR